jgi:glutamate/tyrosine decarboxylase-like PLP-dependent enzyme
LDHCHPAQVNTPELFDLESLRLLRASLQELEKGFSHLPAPGEDAGQTERMQGILLQVARRLAGDFPFFHPLYAGQMLKPPHPLARLAYALSLWINPNNHALDGGRASSQMEKEAVAALATMFGWPTHLGHLTSGGTMANLEALWIAGRETPGRVIVGSEQAHYTHARISQVLGLRYESISSTPDGRMDPEALERRLTVGDVGTVVATVGTTSRGAVDPMPELFELRRKHGFRLHADAAYGGYLTLAENLRADTRRAFDALSKADSIVVDPHKHGLQPYGCGCVLFADPSVGRWYKHDSPYTYFTSNELHLGEISLECSRPGAAAVALWATQQLLPLRRGGDFAARLTASRRAALDLYNRLQSDARFLCCSPPELDIVVWGVRARKVSQASDLAQRIFDAAARRNLHLALATVPVTAFPMAQEEMECDAPTMRCLRSVLMKPEHESWLGRIWEILNEATVEAVGPPA